METSAFPPAFLTPLETAVGPAYPRPALRSLLEDLENVTKRLTHFQMRLAGVSHDPNLHGRKEREERWNMIKAEAKDTEHEYAAITAKLSKMPLSREQFKHPTRELSVCHDAYMRMDIGNDGVKVMRCNECGGCATTYRRVEKEKWAEEWKTVLAERESERKLALKARQKTVAVKPVKPPPSQSMEGGFLVL